MNLKVCHCMGWHWICLMLQPAGDSFTGLFKKPAGSWECSTCLIQNKPEVEKCAACETPRPKPKTSTPSTTSTAKVNYSFTEKCFCCVFAWWYIPLMAHLHWRRRSRILSYTEVWSLIWSIDLPDTDTDINGLYRIVWRCSHCSTVTQTQTPTQI